MIWQDIAIAAAGVVFAAALVPSIAGEEKPALGSWFLSAGMCALLVASFALLSLWLAMSATALNGAAWLTLTGQRVVAARRREFAAVASYADCARKQDMWRAEL